MYLHIPKKNFFLNTKLHTSLYIGMFTAACITDKTGIFCVVHYRPKPITIERVKWDPEEAIMVCYAAVLIDIVMPLHMIIP